MAKYLTDTALRLEIESIFEDAIELAPAERGRWLADRCGTDHRLRSEVDALIAAHESAERVGLLEKSVAAAATAALKDVHRGRRIGAYRVLRELGRGGTGVVFLAERDDGQYQQRVAVKLLQAGPDNETLHRVYARKREFATADSLFRVALDDQRRHVPETHYDVRAIYGFMSERYRLERKPVAAERYARMAQAH